MLAGRRIEGVESDVPGALVLGSRPGTGSVGVDWYPIVPWLAPVLVGLVVGAWLYPGGERGGWAGCCRIRRRGQRAVSGAPGRHSLAVYLGHQLVADPARRGALLLAGVELD